MNSASARLALLLHSELTDLAQLREVLAQENLILQDARTDDLPAVTQRKATLAQRLEQRLHEREALLAEMGHPSAQAGMSAWLATLTEPIRSENTGHWQRLLHLAEECRNEHQLNGKLIGLLMTQNQKALTALLSAGGQPLTYGPDGQQRIGAGSGRRLGSA